MKRSRTGDPDPDATGCLETTHTRAIILTKHVVADHVDLGHLRKTICEEVEAVSIAMRSGSRFLEMQLRLVLADNLGVMPAGFPWKLFCCQAFAAMQTKANPLKPAPMYWEAKRAWMLLTNKPGYPPQITLQAPNSLTFESNAYYRTLLCNYSKVSLCAHVFWTFRFVYPGLWNNLKDVLTTPTSKSAVGSMAILRLALPKDHLDIIDASLHLRLVKFSDNVLDQATNIRWSCLGILDAESAKFPEGKPMRGSKGRLWTLHPKFFPIVPQCRQASRFITLDKQWAWKFFGISKTDTDKNKDVGIASLFSRGVVEGLGHGFDGFPATIKTDGVQLHIPFVRKREVLKSSIEWKRSCWGDGDQDTPSMSHAELMDALGSRNPRGLFHIQATEGLDKDHPALVGAIGIDPGVRNLVTSSLGVKVTREDYYGGCRRKPAKVRGKKRKRRKGWTHSTGAKPARVAAAEASMKASMKGVGQKWDDFNRNLVAWLSCAETLRKYYGSKTWRCSRAARGGGLRRATAVVVARVVPNQQVLVAFGNYQGRRCQHGDKAGPVAVKGLRRALARQRVVIVVDEFRTTLMHHKCGEEMTVCPEDPHEKVCPKHGKVDRDVNAGLNIREVVVEHVVSRRRPSYLRR